MKKNSMNARHNFIFFAVFCVFVTISSGCAIAGESADLAGVSHFWTVPKLENPPVIDGRMSGGEWNQAAAITGFVANDKMTASPVQPVVYGGYDDEYLYVVVVSPIPQGSTMVATLSGADSPVWNDDDVEILLQPSPPDGVVFQLLGGPAGGYVDFENSRDCDSQMVYRSGVTEEQWVAEFGIPFAGLGVAGPVVGDVWGVNFCRGYALPRLWTSWSPAKSFVEAGTFGRMRFGGDSGAVRVKALGNIFAGEVNVQGEILAEQGTFRFAAATEQRVEKPGEINPATVHALGKADALTWDTQQVSVSGGRGVVSYPKQVEMGPSRLAWEVSDAEDGSLVQRHSVSFDTFAPLEVTINSTPAKGIVEVLLDAAGSYTPTYPVEGTVGLHCKKDGALVVSGEAVFSQGKGKAVFELKDLPEGDYIVKASVTVAEGMTVAGSAKYSWAGPIPAIYSEIGYEPEVPSPWTPVIVEGDRVDVWNRSIGFAGSGLPATIENAGLTALARPIVLKAFAGGEELSATVGSVQVTRLSEGSAEASGSVVFPGLSINTRSLTEFDGCIRVELEVTAAVEGPDRLILDVPLPEEFAQLLHSHSLQYRFYTPTSSGSIPTGEGVVWTRPFVPFIWLGNTRAGLCWFAASQKGWRVDSSDGPSQEIVRIGDEVVLRIHLAERPFPAGEVREIVFGLHLTPTKPIRRDWRLKDRYIRHPMAPPELLCNSVIFEAFGKWWGWPEPKGDAQVKRMLEDIEAGRVPRHADRLPVYWSVIKKARDEVHADGGRMIWYAAIQNLGMTSPWCSSYGNDWNLTYGSGYPGYDNPTDEWFWSRAVCPGSEWQDLYVGTIATSSLPAYDFDGVYLDTFLPWKCANATHGCGYIDDNGKRQGEYTIWSMREQMKRLYRVVHARKNGTIVGHVSSTMMPPIYGFIDSAVAGEQYWTYFHVQGGVDYHEMLPLDKCRAEVLGRQWGWAPLWLPQFKNISRETSRDMLSLILLHDSLVIPVSMDQYEAGMSNAVLWKLGFVDAEFVGYFDTPAPASADSPQLYVSAYKNAGGRAGDAILIITNHGPEDGTFNIVPNSEVLGLTTAKWVAAEYVTKDDYTTLARTNDAFEIHLSGRDFAIVSIRAEQK